MDNKNLILNRIFTRKTLNSFLNMQESTVLSDSVEKFSIKTDNLKNNEVITEIYKCMLKSYKNEYIYKNTLLNKLLLGVHSLKTTTALTEVPIEKSKADFILINGKAVVYEIKTELDNLDRLAGQIEDYCKVFAHVCVITNEKNYQKVYATVSNSNTGIYVLTNNNTISCRKKPTEDFTKLRADSIFKVLRKSEYESIIIQFFGRLPKVRQVEYYKACLEMFKKIDILEAYKYVLKELKKRNMVEISEFKKKVPQELKFLVYFSDFKKSDYSLLEEFLNKDFRR